MTQEGSERPLRIMLVEDHISFRQALAFMLNRDPGFEVVAQAGTLAEARRGLDERNIPEGIDAAVIDLALPDGSGVDLIRDLRSHIPNLTVLVLSATLRQANLTKAVWAGGRRSTRQACWPRSAHRRIAARSSWCGADLAVGGRRCATLGRPRA